MENTTIFETEQSKQHQAAESRRNAYLERDKATAKFMSGVFTLMGTAVGITALAAFLISLSPALSTFLFTGTMLWVTMLVPFIYGIILFYTYEKMDTLVATGAFFGYSVLIGISLGYVPLLYPLATLFGAFGISGASFVSLAIFGYTTKKDMSAWGNFLFMALIGLILALVVSVFIPALSLLVSLAGVVLFSGLTAYDTQKIKDMYQIGGDSGNLVVIGAMSLYLDFINLFLFILRSMSGIGNK